MLSCDWLIRNLFQQVAEHVYLIKWPVSVYLMQPIDFVQVSSSITYISCIASTQYSPVRTSVLRYVFYWFFSFLLEISINIPDMSLVFISPKYLQCIVKISLMLE